MSKLVNIIGIIVFLPFVPFFVFVILFFRGLQIIGNWLDKYV